MPGRAMPDLRDEQARAWLVRLNGGRASEADRTAHTEWRQAEAANEAAWTRAAGTWALLGALGSSAAEVENSLTRKRERPVQYRAAVAAGIATLLCLGAAWSYRPYPAEGLFADAATAPGEQRRLALADGSHVTLTGSSAVDIDIAGGSRGVTLLTGEALFEVAHDSDRPFKVKAGDARVTVTGTRFIVRRTGRGATMMLAEGSVDARGEGRAAIVHARPGQRVDWSGAGMSTSAVAIRDVAAWRRGRLIFRSRPAFGSARDAFALPAGSHLCAG